MQLSQSKLSMKTIHIAALVLAALIIGPIMNAENSTVSWKTINEALDQAPKNNKKIVLDVFTDWCGWCKRMDRDTYADSAVAAYLDEHFVASKMNPEKEGSLDFDGKKFSQR